MSSFRKDAANRLLIGGMGSLDHAGSGSHKGRARRKLTQLYPDLLEQPLGHAWCGRIVMTSDHIPKIVRFGPDALMVFGYSGRGIAPGTLFGARAAAALCGREYDGLPVEPVSHYSESLTRLKSVPFEFGAGMYHASRGWI